MTRQAFWIAVASAEHVRRGLAQGFMQVSHGKEAPLKRVRPGEISIGTAFTLSPLLRGEGR